ESRGARQGRAYRVPQARRSRGRRRTRRDDAATCGRAAVANADEREGRRRPSEHDPSGDEHGRWSGKVPRVLRDAGRSRLLDERRYAAVNASIYSQPPVKLPEYKAKQILARAGL